MLLRATNETLDLYGVEVPPCVNRHLPEHRMLRVPCTASLHPDALLASTLMFVYPRKSSLVASYLEAFLDGALQSVAWLGHRSDVPEVLEVLLASFHKVELIEGPGMSAYELLFMASMPRASQR